MSASAKIKRLDQRPMKDAIMSKNKFRFLGLTMDDFIKYFFQGNAMIAIVVLALITISLFSSGIWFLPQNYRNLVIYRQAGLEYVDFLRQEIEDHTALTRYLSSLRQQQMKLLLAEGKTTEQATLALAPLDQFITSFSDAVTPLNDMLAEQTDLAAGIKDKYNGDQEELHGKELLLKAGKVAEADAIHVQPIDFKSAVQPLLDMRDTYLETNGAFAETLSNLIFHPPHMVSRSLQPKMDRFRELSRSYLIELPKVEDQMLNWDQFKPIPYYKALTGFLFGKQWLTASFWQDWYGIIPLLVGSLTVSFVALLIAIPFGVGAAIYINQIATPTEQNLIKPYIEFISAIPSVVLGFFGIAVLGESMRWLSQQEWLAWMPGFPIHERLNIFTAGSLLALMAVPTIFTLTEDAINNVPRAFKEASYALGATRLQTILKIMIPASLSGIISAVLLGLGRVVGETMVVLLCAGGRIEIPDFTQGLTAFFQPVHTMTGIIAQEMGEVVQGSIHFHALFMVGIILFLLSLVINYLAQQVVHKYKISIG